MHLPKKLNSLGLIGSAVAAAVFALAGMPAQAQNATPAYPRKSKRSWSPHAGSAKRSKTFR